MARGIKRAIRIALRNVTAEISDNAKNGGRFAGGLAGEGYAGGYRDALFAVDALLRGVEPSGDRSRRYFEDPRP